MQHRTDHTERHDRRRTRLGARPRLAALLVAFALAVPGALVAGSGSGSASSAYPVTVTATNGKVVIAARPVRIVSLSPTATDMLFAIGAGKQVVAVDSDSTYPKNAPRTSLSGLTPNVEAIAKYRPDLVVVSYDPNGFVAALAKVHIAVLDESAASDLAASYAQITQLGKVTGHTAAATTLVTTMKHEIAAAVASAPRFQPALSYYYEVGEPQYYTATSSTFIGQLLGEFGLKNIADAAKGAAAAGGYPQLTEEYILAKNPEVIFLADTVCCGQSAKSVAKRPGWSAVAAVTHGAVIGLNDTVASQWGPQIVTLATDVAAALAKLTYPKAS